MAVENTEKKGCLPQQIHKILSLFSLDNIEPYSIDPRDLNPNDRPPLPMDEGKSFLIKPHNKRS